MGEECCAITMPATLPVFLFGILGMGVCPSELGKSAHEIWKLGKFEMCLKSR